MAGPDDRPEFLPPEEVDNSGQVPQTPTPTAPLPRAVPPAAPALGPAPPTAPPHHVPQHALRMPPEPQPSFWASATRIDPRQGRTAFLAILGAIVASVMLVVIAAIGIGQLTGRGAHPADPGPSESSAPPPATTSPPRPTPSDTKAPTKPVVPGWQAVVHVKRGVAYDVPRDWAVQSEDTIVGFEDVGPNSDTLAMTGAAEYADGYCVNSSDDLWRAVAGVADAPLTSSVAAAAKISATEWGSVYDDPSEGKHASAHVGPAEPLHVTGAKAYHSRVTVSITGGNACTPHQAVVDVVAVHGRHSNGVFVLVADQGDEGDEDLATINKIIKSVRVFRR